MILITMSVVIALRETGYKTNFRGGKVNGLR